MNDFAEALRGATFYDVSPLIDERLPVFPGHPPIEIEADARTHERDGYFLQQLGLGEHVGAHVDAPAHAVAADGRPHDRPLPRRAIRRAVRQVRRVRARFRPRRARRRAADLHDVERRDGVSAPRVTSRSSSSAGTSISGRERRPRRAVVVDPERPRSRGRRLRALLRKGRHRGRHGHCDGRQRCRRRRDHVRRRPHALAPPATRSSSSRA